MRNQENIHITGIETYQIHKENYGDHLNVSM